MTPSSLAARQVGLARGGRPVLADVSLRVAAGWTAIVGPNGAGKSTLLRVLAGLQAVDRGTVTLDGRALAAWTPRERACRVAWLAQGDGGGTDAVAAGGELTVREAVRLGRLPQIGLFGAATAEDEAAVRRAMEVAGCAAWPARRLAALSGGERQRVLLARALATEAPFVLLDEPTTHLDPPQQVAVVRLLRRLGRSGTGVASVLHDLPLALQADRLVVMQAGRIVADAFCDDLAAHAALTAVFGGAVRVERSGDRWTALPQI